MDRVKPEEGKGHCGVQVASTVVAEGVDEDGNSEAEREGDSDYSASSSCSPIGKGRTSGVNENGMMIPVPI
jgi:hypothetical protein